MMENHSCNLVHMCHRLIGPGIREIPLKLKETWAIWIRPQMYNRILDLAIVSKLRACVHRREALSDGPK